MHVVSKFYFHFIHTYSYSNAPSLTCKQVRMYNRSGTDRLLYIRMADTVDVILHLINSKCVPVLLYGLEVCPLNKADIQSLDFCVYRLLMKLFCTNNLSVIEECRHYFSITLPSELLCRRVEKFLLKLNANCG